MSSISGFNQPSTTASSTPSQAQDHSTASYLAYPARHVVSTLYRRLTDTALQAPTHQSPSALKDMNGTYTPPHRNASPFQPPPLTPLTLLGLPYSSSPSAQILSRILAEEIRLLVPPRLQLIDTWSLTYSLERDGVSLATLYNKCAPYLSTLSQFILVIRDAAGGIFGAYLTSAPHPSPSYYGTGECFLWRTSILTSTPLLSSLPPPPSADTTTTSIARSTTLASPLSPRNSSKPPSLSPNTPNPTTSSSPSHRPSSGTSTPERIRFKAFPYSGVNDYLIFCEQGFLSIGGGDGRYGLWLDGVLEQGISSPCMTFGNEGLSEEGEKFEVVGVEVWCVGREEN
ncbi:oxidation resistance protein 1 [Toensbergia leucococca]|nr:oxidation resistance protein 1 [Toensbergia leucococca]